MVYTFWEGEMPEYIRLCMNTWRFPYIVLNYDNLRWYTELPVEKMKRFTLPQIADCVRVHVLRDNGGYWLDADTISVTGKLPDATILGDPETRTNSIGMLHTKPKSAMFIEWAQYQDEMIRRSDIPDHWAVMGNLFTDSYLADHKEIAIKPIRNCFPESYMINDSISNFSKYRRFYFESEFYLSDIKHTDMLMLHNSWTPAWYKQLPEDEVMSETCTLSNILRKLL